MRNNQNKQETYDAAKYEDGHNGNDGVQCFAPLLHCLHDPEQGKKKSNFFKGFKKKSRA